MRVRKNGQHGAPASITQIPYALDDPKTSECPRSLIPQETEDLVQIVAGFTESELSMAVEHIPGSLFDAIRIARRETGAREAAQDEAMSHV